jgi:hypothetical protein
MATFKEIMLKLDDPQTQPEDHDFTPEGVQALIPVDAEDMSLNDWFNYISQIILVRGFDENADPIRFFNPDGVLHSQLSETVQDFDEMLGYIDSCQKDKMPKDEARNAFEKAFGTEDISLDFELDEVNDSGLSAASSDATDGQPKAIVGLDKSDSDSDSDDDHDGSYLLQSRSANSVILRSHTNLQRSLDYVGLKKKDFAPLLDKDGERDYQLRQRSLQGLKSEGNRLLSFGMLTLNGAMLMTWGPLKLAALAIAATAISAARYVALLVDAAWFAVKAESAVTAYCFGLAIKAIAYDPIIMVNDLGRKMLKKEHAERTSSTLPLFSPTKNVTDTDETADVVINDQQFKTTWIGTILKQVMDEGEAMHALHTKAHNSRPGIYFAFIPLMVDVIAYHAHILTKVGGKLLRANSDVVKTFSLTTESSIKDTTTGVQNFVKGVTGLSLGTALSISSPIVRTIRTEYAMMKNEGKESELKQENGIESLASNFVEKCATEIQAKV